METISWTCPFCERNATLTESNVSIDEHFFHHGNGGGWRCVRTVALVCPNPECKRFELRATLLEGAYNNGHRFVPKDASALQYWQLMPSSSARAFPDYIPAPIREDYEEACLIRDLSPKASATLSRRCLQGIIRDYYGEQKGTLAQEINAS